MTINHLNQLSRQDFTRLVGPVFEHSPWIAETTWSQKPFPSPEALHAALCATVQSAGETLRVQLIQAHPDLVGRAALAGTLTPESQREQAGAGLGALDPAEVALFQRNNAAYRERFGFPFVICARLNKKEAIIAGFAARLQNSRPQEIAMALGEIEQIAWLRLKDLLAT
jgi:2-oxo-4-hydroxy-4-carboxy-5-ureidoimidazoline decarboxylase